MDIGQDIYINLLYIRCILLFPLPCNWFQNISFNTFNTILENTENGNEYSKFHETTVFLVHIHTWHLLKLISQPAIILLQCAFTDNLACWFQIKENISAQGYLVQTYTTTPVVHYRRCFYIFPIDLTDTPSSATATQETKIRTT